MVALLGALKSKTIWVNTIVAGIAAFTDFLSGAGLPAETFLFIQAGANVILRFLTTGSLSDKIEG